MSTRKYIGITAGIVIAIIAIFAVKTLYAMKEFNDGEHYLSNKENSKNYSEKLRGRFVLKGAECAGFTFKDDKTVLWTNELFCNQPDSLSIQWINAATFITKSTEKHDSACPPKISIYEVVTYNSTGLTLKSTWTGWGEHAPESLEFIEVE